MRIVFFVKSVIESQSPFQLSLVHLIFTQEEIITNIAYEILIWKLLKTLYKKISFDLLKSTVENISLLSFDLTTMCQLYF